MEFLTCALAKISSLVECVEQLYCLRAHLTGVFVIWFPQSTFSLACLSAVSKASACFCTWLMVSFDMVATAISESNWLRISRSNVRWISSSRSSAQLYWHRMVRCLVDGAKGKTKVSINQSMIRAKINQPYANQRNDSRAAAQVQRSLYSHAYRRAHQPLCLI